MANENLAEQIIENEQLRTIIRTAKDLQKLKTNPQQIGGDIALVEGSDLATATMLVAPGETKWFSITLTPVVARLQIWDFRFTVYVGGMGPFNIVNQYPLGSAIQSHPFDEDKVRITYLPDWANSSDSQGIRKYYIGIENYGATWTQAISMEAMAYAIKTPTV